MPDEDTATGDVDSVALSIPANVTVAATFASEDGSVPVYQAPNV
jgi:hypothetical protein